MKKTPDALTEKQRSEIFEEGRRAAILRRSPFTCPYIEDESEDRFICWTDGYRSVRI